MPLEPDQNQADLKALLEENLRYTKAIYASTEKARRYILWGQVFGVLKVLLILIPLVLGFWYLKPYLMEATAAYQELLGGSAGSSNTNQSALDQLRALQQSGKLNLQDLLK
jgi:hypothetical protein